MSKRITALDVLGEARRARRILNRLIRYLEQQERAERRTGEKRAAEHRRVNINREPIDDELGEQG